MIDIPYQCTMECGGSSDIPINTLMNHTRESALGVCPTRLALLTSQDWVERGLQ